ncbi:hypothetical protein IHE45_20G019800 [Dioscorea alata]|uniref:Uncharacterized protein n=1 Tax=Dioscorea alata TaxID=55571 RepID=A0ACB7TT39_DIOAL|nr:hypothetical protein IHE45_20G019800 [Dioscorea alata]
MDQYGYSDRFIWLDIQKKISEFRRELSGILDTLSCELSHFYNFSLIFHTLAFTIFCHGYEN